MTCRSRKSRRIMKWNFPVNLNCAAALIVISSVSGCHEWPNMFIDDLPLASSATTATMDRAMQADTVDAGSTRGFAVAHIEAQDGTVVHGPLWFEDPVEMAGSDDGRFAVTFEDHVSVFYSFGRFIVNLGALPLSMIVDRPGAMVCSDGIERRSRRSWLPEPYDAERCSGASEPIDLLEVWFGGGAEAADEDVATGGETNE